MGVDKDGVAFYARAPSTRSAADGGALAHTKIYRSTDNGSAGEDTTSAPAARLPADTGPVH